MRESGQRAAAAAPEAQPLWDAREMVIILDAGERIACWNRAAAEHFDLGDEKAPGAHLQRVYQFSWATPEERRAAFAQSLTGSAWKGRCTRVLGGERVDIESVVDALLNANGECIGRIIRVRAVIQRNRSEAAATGRGAPVRPTANRAEAGMDATSICASCKAMRDPRGDWQSAEAYLGRRFNIAFTHGMCPECIQRFYPDIGQSPR